MSRERLNRRSREGQKLQKEEGFGATEGGGAGPGQEARWRHGLAAASPGHRWPTFLKGPGSELALGDGPAVGQEGAEDSLYPAWVGEGEAGGLLNSCQSPQDTLPYSAPPQRLTVPWGYLSATPVAILRAAEQGFSCAGGKKYWVTPRPWRQQEDSRRWGVGVGVSRNRTEIEEGRWRQRGLDGGQMGCGGGTHTPVHTCAYTHAQRQGWGSGSGDSEKSPLAPQPSNVLPYLLGLGRDLGREAGAGTFKDPAVSVMREHQLGRQVSPPRGRLSEAPQPGPPFPPKLRTQTSLLFSFRHSLGHQFIYLGLLVPRKNDIEGFVICRRRERGVQSQSHPNVHLP